MAKAMNPHSAAAQPRRSKKSSSNPNNKPRRGGNSTGNQSKVGAFGKSNGKRAAKVAPRKAYKGGGNG